MKEAITNKAVFSPQNFNHGLALLKLLGLFMLAAILQEGCDFQRYLYSIA